MQKEKQQKLTVIEETGNWREAEYVIINTTYAVMYSQEAYDEIKENYVLLDEISSYGNTICEVYRKQ